MNVQYVKLADLATELGMDRSHARRYILRNGFSFLQVRDPQSRQLVNALSVTDAEAVREIRQQQGFSDDVSNTVVNGFGWFYIVRLVPEFDPSRVKLGFASDPETRLAAHRTAAPTAELIKAWPCKPTWERAAIASATRQHCRLIANEVYDCDDVVQMVERCDAFFAIMPDQ